MHLSMQVPQQGDVQYPIIYATPKEQWSEGMVILETWRFVFLQHDEHDGFYREKIFDGYDEFDILDQVDMYLQQLAESYESEDRPYY